MKINRPIHTTIDEEYFLYLKRMQDEGKCYLKDILEEALYLHRKFNKNEFLSNAKEVHKLTNGELIDWMINHFEDQNNDLDKELVEEIVEIALNKYIQKNIN